LTEVKILNIDFSIY